MHMSSTAAGTLSTALHNRRAPRYLGPSGHSYFLAGGHAHDGDGEDGEDDAGRETHASRHVSPDHVALAPSSYGPSSNAAAATPSSATTWNTSSAFLPLTGQPFETSPMNHQPPYQQQQPISPEAAEASRRETVRQMLHLEPVPSVQSAWTHADLVRELVTRLPPYEEAMRALQVYRANVTWMWDVIDDWPAFEAEHIAAFYPSYTPFIPSSSAPSPAAVEAQHPHVLSLLFMILSLGKLFDLRPGQAEAGQAESFYRCAWRALSLSNYQDSYTIESVQSLHLIGQYLCNRKSGKHADTFYPLLVTASGLAVAMGLHRDSSDWKESEVVAEERRRLFWELLATDAFRSLAYGRPTNLSVLYAGTKYPQSRRSAHLQPQPQPQQQQQQSSETTSGNGTITTAAVPPAIDFHNLKFRVVCILNSILDSCFHRLTISYDTVQEYDAQLREFQRQIPAHLRPRLGGGSTSASSAAPMSGGFAAAAADYAAMDLASETLFPEDASRLEAMKQELQAHTLAANVEQVILHLHRPWFIRALHSPQQLDPVLSPYSPSVIAVTQSCRALVTLCRSIAQRVPRLVQRWVFWFQHVFNSAICQALYICFAPRSVAVSSVFGDLEEASQVLAHVRADLDVQTWGRRLELLEKLKARAEASYRNGTSGGGGGSISSAGGGNGGSNSSLRRGSAAGGNQSNLNLASSHRSSVSGENGQLDSLVGATKRIAPRSSAAMTSPQHVRSRMSNVSSAMTMTSTMMAGGSGATGMSTNGNVSTPAAASYYDLSAASVDPATGGEGGEQGHVDFEFDTAFGISGSGPAPFGAEDDVLLSGLLGEETFSTESGFWRFLLGSGSEAR